MSLTPAWICGEFLQGVGVVRNSQLEFCWEQHKTAPEINSHSRAEIIYSPEPLQNNTPKTGGFCLFFKPVFCVSFQMKILITFHIGWVQLALPWVPAPPSSQNKVWCQPGWWIWGSGPSPGSRDLPGIIAINPMHKVGFFPSKPLFCHSRPTSSCPVTPCPCPKSLSKPQPTQTPTTLHFLYPNMNFNIISMPESPLFQDVARMFSNFHDNLNMKLDVGD